MRKWVLGLSLTLGCRSVEVGLDSAVATTSVPTVAVDLDNCDQAIDPYLPLFYSSFFACVHASWDDDDVVLWTDGLPPHASAYYPHDHPNHVAFDDRGGTHVQNPGEIVTQSFEIRIPTNPVAKGIVIDDAAVDNVMNTNGDEYGGGGQGVALDGVEIFAAMAAPGDVLADEANTFDAYEGHPAGATYHYHFNTPGPQEVLADRSLTPSTTPGSADVELYGVMCDGTLVFGCTELDGSPPDDSDFDAQNGHLHDIDDRMNTYFFGRYHTHVCPSLWPDYVFFPEVAYYETSGCPAGGP